MRMNCRKVLALLDSFEQKDMPLIATSMMVSGSFFGRGEVEHVGTPRTASSATERCWIEPFTTSRRSWASTCVVAEARTVTQSNSRSASKRAMKARPTLPVAR